MINMLLLYLHLYHLSFQKINKIENNLKIKVYATIYNECDRKR